VESILSQTYKKFNLHILDNCSNDGSLEWIKSVQDDRIIIYPSDKKLTIEYNWSRIKDIPMNEFITLIGHDDILLKNYLQEMDLLIEKYPDASLYQAHFDYINANGNFVHHCKPMKPVMYVQDFLQAQFTRSLDSTGTGYMMRSKDYVETGGIPGKYPNLIFADFELWVRLISKNYLAVSPEKSFHYRVHKSTSTLTNGDAYQKAFEYYVLFLKNASEKYSQISNTIDSYFQPWLYFMCEHLSHRLLKTPKEKRQISVQEFIEKCKDFAHLLIPEKEFVPRKIFRIWVAALLDKNQLGRGLFNAAKRLGIKL
jgi:glycosyltransferase involved in cell wall biosynthesis